MADWTVTGLGWHDGVPRLGATDWQREHAREITAGLRIGWRVSGPRRCTGVRSSRGHRRCPYREQVAPQGGSSQCETCQRADPGLALARDQILDDGRPYRLYLAWFGAGLLKVGLTGEHRGIARLLDQAAPVFTFVGRGRLPAVRRAELTVAQAGLARERVRSSVKAAAWWGLAEVADRRAELLACRREVLRLLAGHGIELLPDSPVVDQVGLFGLAEGAPAAYRKVTALSPGATLVGTVRPAIGSHLFIDPQGADGHPQDQPLLLDTRLLAGWGLAAADDVRGCSGLGLRDCVRPSEPGAQDALF
ncbi:DUF2797 domain-containing protein [Kitasatospora sp. NBC_00374]|uniref:DUF2797 domain-containing protein n=1 Tax=Kitasatospora sp. NBC_00374 TaxID=2975964 RepID=UPI00324C5D83